MPIHDWSRVSAGLFHDFQQSWSIRIKDSLNAGLLHKREAALVEQRAGPLEGDVLSIEGQAAWRTGDASTGGVATEDRPATQIIRRSTRQIYARRANRIVVRHHLGRIIAVLEIVSPGNKDSRSALRDFVEKTIDFLRRGIHVLIVDLFPPIPRDPLGLHKAIWDEIEEEEFLFPPGKDRVLASYEAGAERVAYVEPVGVGDQLPKMSLFLACGVHVMVPLEATYQQTWDAGPQELRTAVETGVLPELQGE